MAERKRWAQSETGRTGIWSRVCLHYYWVSLLEVCTVAWDVIFLALNWCSTACGSHFPIHLGLRFPFVRNSPHFPPPALPTSPSHLFLWTEPRVIFAVVSFPEVSLHSDDRASAHILGLDCVFFPPCAHALKIPTRAGFLSVSEHCSSLLEHTSFWESWTTECSFFLILFFSCWWHCA